jgi:hypothetical protein
MCECVCLCACVCVCVCVCVVFEAVCSYMPLPYMFLCSKSLNSKERVTILHILLNVPSLTKTISKIYFVDFAVCKLYVFMSFTEVQLNILI